MVVENNPVLLGDEVFDPSPMVAVSNDEDDTHDVPRVHDVETVDLVSDEEQERWTMRKYALLKLMTKGVAKPFEWDQLTVPNALCSFSHEEMADKLAWLKHRGKAHKREVSFYMNNHKEELEGELKAEAEMQDQDDEDL